MNILVTGGAGFIGSHTVVELLCPDNGLSVHKLIILDNFCNAKPEVIDTLRQITGRDILLIEGDMRDKDKMDALFREHAIDCVVHFAGLKAVGESVSMPLAYYDNNITGTLTLLAAMQAHGVKRMVFSSSATVYGMDNPVPFKEEYPTSATNPYGYTKVVIERMLTDLCHADPAWSVSLLRYFNPIGAHESGLIGEDPAGIPNNLLPYVSQVAAGRLPSLPVYGNDYDTPDGTGVRDYIHVVDLARGHVDALKYVMAHTGIEAVNLGTGKGVSVLQIIHAFEKACGHTIPHEINKRRPGDIATCYADTEKARRLYGFHAKYTIDDMCRDGWRFAKSRYEG